MSKIIIFLGVPGSGKGTQAKRLSNEYGYNHISTGDLLRKEVEKASELGLKIKDIISKGFFVSNEIIGELVISNIKVGANYILDGYPRNLEQAKFWDECLNKNNLKIDKVIYLDLLDEDIIKRLTGRRSCKKCGKEYNVYLNPSSKGENCEVCDTKLDIRSDDSEETIKNRLSIYNKETAPLVFYYENQGLLVKINSSNTIDNVYNLIVKNLN